MITVRTSRIATANLGLTESQEASICAAPPRSSNGKTTDSDSVHKPLASGIFRNSDTVCSSPKSNAFSGDCELLAELTRVKAAFQLRTICTVMGVNPDSINHASGNSGAAGGLSSMKEEN